MLTDIYLSVIACDCNAPSDQCLCPSKSVVSEKNVLCANPTPLRIIVTSFGNPVRLHGKVNPGVPDVDDLQVTHGTARAEFSSADLSVGNPLGAVRQFLRDEFAQRDAAQFLELLLILPEALLEIAGVPAVVPHQFGPANLDLQRGSIR